MSELSIPELAEKHESQWAKGYRAFPELINKLGLKTGVEVGVAFGGHSAAILKLTAISRLTGVDAYTHRPGYDDPMNLPQPAFDELHQFATGRLKTFGNRFNLLRQDAVQAARQFVDAPLDDAAGHAPPTGEDAPLDFVYLDADHSEAGLRRELAAWFPKIRTGGILAGHDYGHRDFPGVQRAVDPFVGRLGLTAQRGPLGLWWIVKPPCPVTYFIPCFNAAAWIDMSVQSILEGNARPNDQLILVNDGSEDDTAKRINNWAKEDNRIRAIHHPVNRGGAAARNTAVRSAKHQLVLCLDADNVLPSGTADKLLRRFAHTDDDAVTVAELRFFKTNAKPGQTTHSVVYPQINTDPDDPAATLQDYLNGGYIPGDSGTVLFTKQGWTRAGGYPEHAGALDAWGFGLRLTLAGSRIAIAHNSCYHHRYSHESYWTRDHKAGKLPPLAADLLTPTLHRLVPEDQRYIQSTKGRNGWYGSSPPRPLRLRHRPPAPARSLAHFFFRRKLVDHLGLVPAAADTRRLRLVLGLPGTKLPAIFNALAHTGTDMRAYLEPLSQLPHTPPLSSHSDTNAAPFADELPNNHPLAFTYRALAADHEARLSDAGLTRNDSPAKVVLVGETHALLATPALLATTKAPVILVNHDPIRVADTIIQADGPDSTILRGEAIHTRSPEFLAAVLDPQRHEDTARVQAEIDSLKDTRLRRIADLALTTALIGHLFERCQRLFPNVALISQDQLAAQPEDVLPRLAATLGLPWDNTAKQHLQEASGADQDANAGSLDTLHRLTHNPSSPQLQVLTESETKTALGFLERCGLTETTTTQPTDARPPLQKAG
ncbi:MAG: glycosyltransferase [Planctomycetota bacterium]